MAETLRGFDWDEGNLEKCQKHGVSRAEIEEVFRGTPVIVPAKEGPFWEMRFLAIGRNGVGRYVFMAFTIRKREGGRYLRPISARSMHRREIDLCEITHS